MQTKHLCVLIHIWTKGEVGAPLNRFKTPQQSNLLTVPRRYFLVDLLCFFCLVFAMHLYASIYMYIVVACCERADLMALVCGV